jgi:coenzyme F420-reducing hydrogenase beta subunit
MELPGKCTGCGACYGVCKEKAIRYQLNEKGFYEAELNEERCIRCGQCARVCYKNPVNRGSYDLRQIKEVYAAQSREKRVVKQSTSGGIAYELAKQVLLNGGRVMGTGYNYESRRAETVIIDHPEQLKSLQGSKYLQSNTADNIQRLISEMEKDKERNYIVFGTPCQIFGISKAAEMKHFRDRMLLVEVFCHGVPSYLLWDNYLSDQEKAGKISYKVNKVSFRDKRYGWGIYTLSVHSANKTVYSTSDSCDFYKVYFDHIALHEACFQCNLRKYESSADIRLGDFWGPRYANRKDGISAVVILSERGYNLWNQVHSKLAIYGKHKISECINYQSTHNYYVNNSQMKLFYQLINENRLSLKSIRRQYRKGFSRKKRMVLFLKDLVSQLPIPIKVLLKKVLNRLNYKGKISDEG